MPNFVSKYASLFLIVILLVISLYNRTEYIERYVFNQVNVYTNHFQKEVRRKGYVDKKLYDNLLKDLAKTGRLYDIELLHRDIRYYPMDKNENELGYKAVTFKHNENEILDILYSEDKNYYMKIGDDFHIDVKEKGESINNILWSALTKDSKQDGFKIFASYGGMIENEVN